MKFIQILLILLLFSCSQNHSEQQEFFSELGTEKTESFKTLTKNYKTFLDENFPSKSGIGEQSREFIKRMLERKEPLSFDSVNAILVLREFERSGLRKDIFLYIDESYNKAYNVEHFLPERGQKNIDLGPINENFEELFPIDSIKISKTQKQISQKRERELERNRYIIPNENGLYNYALAKAFKSDTSLLAYCELRQSGLSPALTTEYAELPEAELKLWKNQIPLIVDFYYREMLWRYGKYIK
ncbi:hypothetical protein QYS48_34205 [Marivirga arenosa]|uniref:Lipoprotein n=1 Tax=Marivirga arenosa TaxID=3059076 RepID=A0AA51R6R2_9BACT|nr:hypothetical protein [Marivirga sp. ABR2-2]WMN06907.1 hypothetical protein QYS48_34205 [Marivirga sp. ABR2-2]